jgi:L-ascorbate metabolism protein UlaG (beta-lactamase superfamily)
VRSILLTAIAFLLPAASTKLEAQPERNETVKVTPLGSKTGEFCFLDRAMVFEDPTGLRILYDPGFTVAGSTDPRLGTIDVTLLSHAHADHIGTGKLNQDPNASTAVCSGAFPQSPAVPNSNLAEITANKHAAFIGTPALAPFIGAKMQAILGTSVGYCGGASNSPAPIVVPLGSSCLGIVNFGGTRTVERPGSAGVQIAVVPAFHDNGIPNSLLADPLSTELASQGLTFQPAPPVGYVVTFTNGLTVYLSGDTGQTAEMKLVAEFYHPGLAVINMGDIFTTGPQTAAAAINKLVRPKSVIPSHSNEVATSGGVVIPGTRTAQFLNLIEMPGHVPLSGATMQFDGEGRCIAGCN